MTISYCILFEGIFCTPLSLSLCASPQLIYGSIAINVSFQEQHRHGNIRKIFHGIKPLLKVWNCQGENMCVYTFPHLQSSLFPLRGFSLESDTG